MIFYGIWISNGVTAAQMSEDFWANHVMKWDDERRHRSCFVKVMEKRKRILGPEHPDTLSSMDNLALTYWNQGRWEEVEELEVQVKRKSGTKGRMARED